MSSTLAEHFVVLDRFGIDAQGIYPSTIGLGGHGLGSVADQDLCRISVEIYHDGMAEVQEQSGNRLLPMPIMPAWDIDLCVAEAKRAAGMGLRGVNMTSDPQESVEAKMATLSPEARAKILGENARRLYRL